LLNSDCIVNFPSCCGRGCAGPAKCPLR